jgi:hypothetical protein
MALWNVLAQAAFLIRDARAAILLLLGVYKGAGSTSSNFFNIRAVKYVRTRLLCGCCKAKQTLPLP